MVENIKVSRATGEATKAVTFAAGPEALAQICDLLGFDEKHHVQRLVIDISVDGLVTVLAQEIIEQAKFDSLIGVIKNLPPATQTAEGIKDTAHNTSTQKNKRFSTYQAKKE